MRAAGEATHFTYDTDQTVEPGDILETRTGRRYLVDDARRGSEVRSRPGHYRWSCSLIVLAGDDPTPEDATVHPLYWYVRRKKGGR